MKEPINEQTLEAAMIRLGKLAEIIGRRSWFEINCIRKKEVLKEVISILDELGLPHEPTDNTTYVGDGRGGWRPQGSIDEYRRTIDFEPNQPKSKAWIDAFNALVQHQRCERRREEEIKEEIRKKNLKRIEPTELGEVLVNINEHIQCLAEEYRDWHDNMPDNMRDSARGDYAQQAADGLDEMNSELDSFIEGLNNDQLLAKLMLTPPVLLSYSASKTKAIKRISEVLEYLADETEKQNALAAKTMRHLAEKATEAIATV